MQLRAPTHVAWRATMCSLCSVWDLHLSAVSIKHSLLYWSISRLPVIYTQLRSQLNCCSSAPGSFNTHHTLCSKCSLTCSCSFMFCWVLSTQWFKQLSLTMLLRFPLWFDVHILHSNDNLPRHDASKLLFARSPRAFFGRQPRGSGALAAHRQPKLDSKLFPGWKIVRLRV